ncbi:MAG TPA: GNAT family N-acetyltransferase [Chitinophagaceae bacterium]|nr:GNAT family N-acetyltransferase [Chitinophagaceae bacterium]
MLHATVAATDDDLWQIHLLNQANYRQHVSAEVRDNEGFVSWFYPVKLLQQTQQLAPHVIVKEGDTVAGYALTLLREAALIHADLKLMFDNLEPVTCNGKPLTDYRIYCMGQVCIDKPWRGKGVFNMLYQHHKKLYAHDFDMIITEISLSNPRSQRAHEKVGFKTIYTYTDANDEWNVVAWDWQ